MKRTRLFIPVLMASVPASTLAEDVKLNRVEALSRALARHPKIAAAQADVAQAEAKREQADALRWPEITADIGVGPSLQADLVEGTAVQSVKSRYDVDFSDLSIVIGGQVNVLQPLYTFGKIDRRREAAAHGLRARKAQAMMTEQEVGLEVARIYEGYLYARDAERFFEEVVHLIERSIEETQARLESPQPDVSEKDLLRLQSAKSIGLTGLHQARAGKAQAAAGLVAYLGLPEGSVIEVAEDELTPVSTEPSSLERMVGLALERRPELVALDQGSRAFAMLAEAEEAGYWPDFFLLGFFSGAYTPGRDLIRTRYVTDPLYSYTPGILLGARWQLRPFFPGSRADEMRAEATRLAALGTWAKEGIPAEVARAYWAVDRHRKDIETTEPAVKRATQWIVRANADYQVGLDDSRSLTDAVQAYAVLRTKNLQARYGINVALAELAKTTGTLNAENALYPGAPASKGESK